MDKTHLLMVGGWTDTIRKALELGYEVSYIGPIRDASGFDSTILNRCIHVREVAIDQIGICLALAKEIHSIYQIDAVISFTELGMETAAILAEVLRVKGLELWPVSVTRYKDCMRKALDKYPSLILPWKRISSAEELVQFYKNVGPNIIIKPISGAGSVGIKQIKSSKELETLISEMQQTNKFNCLAEKLIDSDLLYSIESISADSKHSIITMSVSKLVGYPYSLQNHIVVPPYNMSNSLRDSIADIVRYFLSSIGMINGVAHTEVKVDENGKPFIIESQTRVGGDRIWRMVELTTGVHQIDLALLGLKKPVVTADFPASHSTACFFCLLPPEGTVVAVSDLKFLSEMQDIHEYRFDIAPGDNIALIRDNTERRGHVFLEAKNHSALFNKINEICQKIWVEYSDGKIWHPNY